MMSKGLGTAAASIGTLIGLDAEEGFDIGQRNEENHEQVYLLPLSE